MGSALFHRFVAHYFHLLAHQNLSLQLEKKAHRREIQRKLNGNNKHKRVEAVWRWSIFFFVVDGVDAVVVAALFTVHAKSLLVRIAQWVIYSI